MQSDVGALPVRGSDAIEILENDHQTIKELLATLTEPMQREQRAELLERLKAVLTIHNATEENLVYPALNNVAGKKSEAERLYHETSKADVLVFELDMMLKQGNDSDFVAKAQKLQAAVLEHIDDEEGSAFPHLRDHATAEEAQMLTASVQEFRSALRFVPAETGSEKGEI